MASPKRIERRKAILKARGVPDKFIDAIATRKRGDALVIGFALAFLILLFGLIIALTLCGYAVTAWLDGLLHPAARNSLLVYHGNAIATLPSFLILPMVFAGYLFTTGLQSRRVKPWPAFSVIANRLRSDTSGQPSEAIQPSADYSKLAGLPDDAAFLNALRPPKTTADPGSEGVLAVLCLPLLLSCLFAGWATIDSLTSYKVLRTDAYEVHNLSGPRIYPLADARLAYVLCRGAQYRFDYRVRWPGMTVSLWEASDPLHHLDRRQIIERLATIDNNLTRDHVRVDRMPPSPEAEACVAADAEGWPQADRALLHRLVFGQ